MTDAARFLEQHVCLSRRFFLRLGLVGAAAGLNHPASGAEIPRTGGGNLQTRTVLHSSVQVSRRVPWKTGSPQPVRRGQERGRTYARDVETKRAVRSGISLVLGRQFSQSDGSALDFATLRELGKKHTVRFAKVMTCLNIGCPLGMGVWEGVALRDIIWMATPKANLRRVHYHGYHNDDPKQLFRSSLPIGRVLEDPDGIPPVILCYKLNGEYLSSKRGGPVRMIVPEAYGFKSVKWLTHVFLSNIAHANDTYAGGNNDIDSPLKTFSATLMVPEELRADRPIPITGFAQVGVSGLSKVQVWVARSDSSWPAEDPYFKKAPWTDAHILPLPRDAAAQLPPDTLPKNESGYGPDGSPAGWPLRLSMVHWAALLPGLPAGDYIFRSRTVDARGQAQPMPRPFDKSGRCNIESIAFTVKP